eukprot:SM000189S04080  [mRNA]  locus=s189:275431:278462:+ [translate_table: standard]
MASGATALPPSRHPPSAARDPPSATGPHPHPAPSTSARPGEHAAAPRLVEPDFSSSDWYFSREHIEQQSPSRKDGIGLSREIYLRKSYCAFLQDLGMRLGVPQITIATSIVFCHRFFLRQSHLKNDRFMIATICMFLAGKVEETPKSLKDVIRISYESRHKKDPAQLAQFQQRYEAEKELLLVGERLVLNTLGFDLNINHPYKPLVTAIKMYGVAQQALAQVAWNFVNDGLRTSLCLQFKPHHISAGAIFLAAKFLKVKLPSTSGRPWFEEFQVTPRQLEDVSNQMLELYEQNKSAPNSRQSDEQAASVGTATSIGRRHQASGSTAVPRNQPAETRSSKKDESTVEDDRMSLDSTADAMAATPRLSPSGSTRLQNGSVEGQDHLGPGGLQDGLATLGQAQPATLENEWRAKRLRLKQEKEARGERKGGNQQVVASKEELQLELERELESAMSPSATTTRAPAEKRAAIENGMHDNFGGGARAGSPPASNGVRKRARSPELCQDPSLADNAFRQPAAAPLTLRGATAQAKHDTRSQDIALHNNKKLDWDESDTGRQKHRPCEQDRERSWGREVAQDEGRGHEDGIKIRQDH